VLWRATPKPEPEPEVPLAEAPLDGVIRSRAPPAGCTAPVVLVHGLFGFDRIGIPGARFDYFRGSRSTSGRSAVTRTR